MTIEQLSAVEVAPDLWQLSLPIHTHFLGGANAFLLRGDDGYALIDCGADSPDCVDGLTRFLAELRIPLDALHTIILTHGHPDHSGQANRLREQTRAQILIHERDARFIGYPERGGQADRLQLADWLRQYGFPEPEIETQTSLTSSNRWQPTAIQADRLLTGGETLQFGSYRFEVRWVPGHTPGHICLHEPARRILLCGDHILEAVLPNVCLHPLTAGNPMPSYLDSLTEFAKSELDITLPGHGEPVRDLGALTSRIRKRQLRRRDELLALLTTTPQTAYELASQIWAERGRSPWGQMRGHLRRNAVGTIAAHLEVMASLGEIAREEEVAIGFRLRS